MLGEALGTVTAAFQPTIGPRGGRYDSLATSVVKSAMRAASSQSGGSSFAEFWEEFSVAAAPPQIAAAACPARVPCTSHSDVLHKQIAGYVLRSRRFELFLLMASGAPAGLALSFFPPFSCLHFHFCGRHRVGDRHLFANLKVARDLGVSVTTDFPPVLSPSGPLSLNR